MDESLPPLTRSGQSDPAAARSLVDDLHGLADDARAWAEAEAAYQKARAELAGGGIKGAVGLGALGLALVFFALMALVLGAVLALTPLIGAFGATAAVVGGLLVGALLCFAGAKARWARMARHLSGKDAVE